LYFENTIHKTTTIIIIIYKYVCRYYLAMYELALIYIGGTEVDVFDETVILSNNYKIFN
jgi:hypothetical protein